ncbi:MAG: hypothetical protein IPK34_08255, partial [Ramlibacter sp.]|nr:hypothetical protein [Ramlibacter sp.]
ESLDDVETCVEVLADERLRAEFTVKLKQFHTGSLDAGVCASKGLAFSKDAKTLSYIYARARYKESAGPGQGLWAQGL